MERADDDDVPLLDGTKPPQGSKFPGCRHVLVFMAFLGFVNVYALRVNLSVAIVTMVKHTDTPSQVNDTSCPGENHNSTHHYSKEGEFSWDSKTQGLVLGSFFYGYICTQVPGGWLAEQYGGKKLFGFGVLCTAVFTLLTPVAARINVYLLVATRILEGLGEGVTFPAMHAMLSRWAPLYERSKLGTMAYAGAQFGTVLSLPISGLLCEYGFAGGWPSVFYVFGTCGIVWFVFWMWLIHDTPAQHPRISSEERQYIEYSIGHSSSEKLPTAWRSIFTSIRVYAIVVAHFCNNWGFYTLLTNLPTYMRDILHFDISQNGFLSALPYLAMWIMILVGGQLADMLRFKGILTTTATRKLFNTVGLLIPAAALVFFGYLGCDPKLSITVLCITLGFQGLANSGVGLNHIDIAPPFAGLVLPAIFLVAVGFVGCHSNLAVAMVICSLGSQALVYPGFNLNHIDIAPPFAGQVVPALCLVIASYLGCDTALAVLAVTLSVGSAGLALSGYQVNHLDIAPPFAGTLMGISNMVATIPGFAGPAVVGLLTTNGTAAEWRLVFFISAAVYVFGAIFFLIFGTGVEQPWAKPAAPSDPLSVPGQGYGDSDGGERHDAILDYKHQAAPVQ